MPLDPRVKRFLDVLAAAAPRAAAAPYAATSPHRTPSPHQATSPHAAVASPTPRNARDYSVAERRQGLAQLLKLNGPPAPVSRVEDRLLPGPSGHLAVRIYTPADSREDRLPGLLYFHGGGFIAGSVATHDSIARALANSAMCRIVSVDYRLAPEHPFPAALNDALAAVAHVGSHSAQYGIDPLRLGFAVIRQARPWRRPPARR